jgi:hypothetical protein
MRTFLCLCGLLAALPAFAGSLSVAGDLDPLNDSDVALISFTLAMPAAVDIQTWGYGGTADAPSGTNAAGSVVTAGGFDPYVSLFDGLGAGGVFRLSNDDGACPVGHAAPACHDSSVHLGSLPAGSYTLAVSVFLNMSFAENFGGGTLGDGFIGLGNYYDADSNSLRSSHYAVDISSLGIQSSVPEPASLMLIGFGLLLLVATRPPRT